MDASIRPSAGASAAGKWASLASAPPSRSSTLSASEQAAAAPAPAGSTQPASEDLGVQAGAPLAAAAAGREGGGGVRLAPCWRAGLPASGSWSGPR